MHNFFTVMLTNNFNYALLTESCQIFVDPVLNSPTDVKSRTFLPDPTDGSLYMYSATHNGLKKMPFSIPELVSLSPCKSNEEGILYTGKH